MFVLSWTLLSLNLKPDTTGNYLVAFLARHPSDNKRTDDDARWLTEWHAYSIGTDNIPDFGQQVLFHRLRKPPLDKYRLWTDTILISDSNCCLSGPFHFEARHDVLNPCNYIARDQWLLLHSFCSVSSVVPPILFPAAATPINPSSKTPDQNIQSHFQINNLRKKINVYLSCSTSPLKFATSIITFDFRHSFFTKHHSASRYNCFVCVTFLLWYMYPLLVHPTSTYTYYLRAQLLVL